MATSAAARRSYQVSILQMVVRQIDDRDAADRQALRIRRLAGVDEEGSTFVLRKPIAISHGVQVFPVEYILRQIIVRYARGVARQAWRGRRR